MPKPKLAKCGICKGVCRCADGVELCLVAGAPFKGKVALGKKSDGCAPKPEHIASARICIFLACCPELIVADWTEFITNHPCDVRLNLSADQTAELINCPMRYEITYTLNADHDNEMILAQSGAICLERPRHAPDAPKYILTKV